MKSEPIVGLRIIVMMAGVCLVFGGLIGRLYYLQIIAGPETAANSESQNTYRLPLPATRGMILDRHGRELALNEKNFTIIADKKLILNGIAKGESPIRSVTEAIWQVGTILKMDPHDIQRHVQALEREKVRSREIARNVPESVKDEVMKTQIPGISDAENPCRFYPEGKLAGHLLGYTGADNTGRAGLEYSLNSKLESAHREVIVHADKDIHRQLIAEDDYTKLVPRGADAVLTLDSYIQFVAERELEKICNETEAKQAHAVVLNSKSGEILALACYPGFDPNHNNEYSEEAQQNPVMTQAFEPGSIMKPFILTAALDQGVVTPERVFYCENGLYLFKGLRIRDDIHRFENLSVRDILVRSSNIGFVKIAQQLGGNPDDFRGQAKILYDYLRMFGFKDYSDGEKTTDDLPGESCGILPKPEEWFPYHIGAIPFGHGITTNVLILASAYNALANRGIYHKSYIIRGYRGRDGILYPRVTTPPFRIVSNKVIDTVVDMMVDVTEDPEGTGYGRVRIPGFHIAGKTGTAQKVDPKTATYGYKMRIASFGGFFPAEDPRATIVVMVDEPKNKKYGGEVAGPVFQAIAEELVAYWGLSPTYDDDPLLVQKETAKPNPDTKKGNGDNSDLLKEYTAFGVTKTMPIQSVPVWPEEPDRVPDLIGLPIREAFVRLAVNGLNAQFAGSGKVVEQAMPAGTFLNGQKSIGAVRCEPVLTDPDARVEGDMLVKR